MKLETNARESGARGNAVADCAPVGRVLSATDAAARFGVSFSTLKRGWPTGRFPAPIRISENRIGWLEVEIDRWQRERIAERDARVTAAA